MSFQTSCYLLSTAAVTWSKAEEQCRTHGAHLVVLNNVEELVMFKFAPAGPLALIVHMVLIHTQQNIS